MNIDEIQNGYVIDHIKAKNAMNIYNALNLQELDTPVALITNVKSNLMGKKDIIKISEEINLDMDMLGFLDKDVTVNIIKEGKIIEKSKVNMPEEIVNLAKCQNPRCITTCERELDQVFYLKNDKYRCKYCEQELK